MKLQYSSISYKCNKVIEKFNDYILILKLSYGFVPSSWINDDSLISTENPIVIGGCGRSGTTLLNTMLNAHPKIFCSDEYPLLVRSGFNLNKLSKNLNLNNTELTKIIKNSKNRVEFIEKLFNLIRSNNNKEIITTTWPNYIFYLNELFFYFPNIKFIHIVRDGRDVALSFRNNMKSLPFRHNMVIDKEGYPSMEYLATIWKTFINAFNKWENNKRCLMVKYEDLILRPENTLNEICNFIGVEFDANMLNHHSVGLKGINDKDLPHHVNLKKPLIKSRVYAWKNTLNTQQLQLFEKIAYFELKHYGYEIIGK